MTLSEFSNEFDVLYANIASNGAPGLDEYEKSVFLTKAEKMIVRRQFDPVSDQLREGFDGSQQRQYDFSSLIVTENLENITNFIDDRNKLDKRSSVFIWPKKCFLALNEIVTDFKDNSYTVNPISYDNYYRFMAKPYKYPTKNVAWRLMTNNNAYNLDQLAIDWNDNVMYDKAHINPTQLTIGIELHENYGSNYIEILLPEIEDGGNRAKITIEISYNGILRQLNLPQLWEILLHYPSVSKIKLDLNSDTGDVEYVAPQGQNQISDEEISDEEISDYAYFEVDDNNHFLYSLFYGKSFEFNHSFNEVKNSQTYNSEEEAYISGFNYLKRNDFNLISTIIEVIGRFHKPNSLTSSTDSLTSKNIKDYTLRYVKEVPPIILVDLGDEGLSIDGIPTPTECELPPECHQEIVELAVSLAKVAMAGSTETLAASAQQNSRNRNNNNNE